MGCGHEIVNTIWCKMSAIFAVVVFAAVVTQSSANLCQVPYLFFSTSLGTFSYNTQESTSSPSMVNDHRNALFSFDGVNKRLYLYTVVEGIISYNLDGSDRTGITIDNVDIFTVDGRNNLIYYHHAFQGSIFVYNMTSGLDAPVVALSGFARVKDLEMDMTNGYLYIGRSNTPAIVRYDPSDPSPMEFKNASGLAQSISVDEYDDVIYWANYDGENLRVMKTLFNGETVDLNITYSGDIEVTSDILNFYVLDKDNNRIDKYLKTSLEKQGNITYNGVIQDFIIAYDEDECCVGTFCPINSSCSDSLGGFTCSCNNGFSWNGTDCEVLPILLQ